MDLSQLSDADLEAVARGDMSKVSDAGLNHIANQPRPGETSTTVGQTALEHFGNAVAQNYLPNLQAAAEPITDRIFNKFSRQQVEPAPLQNLTYTGAAYEKSRDQNKDRLALQQQEHPLASLIASTGGTFASAIPMAEGIAAGTGLGTLAKATAPEGAALAGKVAALAKRSAGAAGIAGIQGALANPASGDQSDRLKNAELAAIMGGGTNVAAEGLGAAGTAAKNYLGDKAERLAFRALGPFKRQVNQNRDEINQIGREALDSGVIGWKPGNAATIEERAADASSKAGKQLGDLTDELAQLESQASYSGIKRKQIADNLRSKLLVDNPQKIPGIAQKNQTFSNMIDAFENAEGAPANMSFKDMRQAKMSVQGTKSQDGLINYNRLKNADIPVDEQFHRALAQQLKAGEESGADAIEKAFYGDKSNRLVTAKNKFGNLEEASKIASNRADAQRANQILGLKDAIYGSAGAGLGGYLGYQLGGHEGSKAGAAIGGGLGAFGNKFSRDYGSQLSAKSIDTLAKMTGMSSSLAKAVKSNPSIIPMLLQNNESSQALERRLKEKK